MKKKMKMKKEPIEATAIVHSLSPEGVGRSDIIVFSAAGPSAADGEKVAYRLAFEYQNQRPGRHVARVVLFHAALPPHKIKDQEDEARLIAANAARHWITIGSIPNVAIIDETGRRLPPVSITPVSKSFSDMSVELSDKGGMPKPLYNEGKYQYVVFIDDGQEAEMMSVFMTGEETFETVMMHTLRKAQIARYNAVEVYRRDSTSTEFTGFEFRTSLTFNRHTVGGQARG